MKLNRMLVVLSACTGSALDSRHMDNMRSTLVRDGFSFDTAEGCYNGTTEDSFIVQCADFVQVGQLVRLALRFNQESVMLVDAHNRAYLLFCNGCSMQSLGYVQHKDMAIPGNVLPEVAYTKVGNDVYYTI